MELLGFTSPELVRILHRLGVEFPILGHASDAGFFGKSGRGLEDPVLDEVGFDVLGALGDLRGGHGGNGDFGEQCKLTD
jgi:hypothetical protein